MSFSAPCQAGHPGLSWSRLSEEAGDRVLGEAYAHRFPGAIRRPGPAVELPLVRLSAMGIVAFASASRRNDVLSAGDEMLGRGMRESPCPRVVAREIAPA